MQIMNFVEATDRGEQNAQESYVFCREDSRWYQKSFRSKISSRVVTRADFLPVMPLCPISLDSLIQIRQAYWFHCHFVTMFSQSFNWAWFNSSQVTRVEVKQFVGSIKMFFHVTWKTHQLWYSLYRKFHHLWAKFITSGADNTGGVSLLIVTVIPAIIFLFLELV